MKWLLEQLERYIRVDKLPHLWCPGCGNGIVVGALVRAIHELEYEQDKVVVVGGIGCASRAVNYLNFDTLHTTHGRALAFATGIKLARPELNIFVIMGDGDSVAIGGNHFIHAARRNIDLTAIIVNNFTYGMTGGQYSPQTPIGQKATTAPYGMMERSFDIAELARAAGATYIGRATVYHANLLTRLIVAGSRHKGFSVIEVLSMCPTGYGRRNDLSSPAEMLKWFAEHTVRVKRFTEYAAEKEKVKDKFIIGELYRAEVPDYITAYENVVLETQVREASD